jgi:hypothetical protein
MEQVKGQVHILSTWGVFSLFGVHNQQFVQLHLRITLFKRFLQFNFLPLLICQKRVEIALHKSAVCRTCLFLGIKFVGLLAKDVVVDG